MSDKLYHFDQLKGSSNYTLWAVRAKAILTKENLIRAIKIDTNEPVNDKALSYIQLLCMDGPIQHIKDMTSAHKAWKCLEDVYNPQSFTTSFLLLRQLYNSKLDAFETMEEYLNEVKRLVDELRTKNVELPEQAIFA